MRKVLEEYSEIPVPAGLLNESTGSRLDSFTKACVAQIMAPSNESAISLTALWHKFSDEEKRMLKLEPILRLLRVTVLIGRFLRFDTMQQREVLIHELMKRTAEVRIGIRIGRIRRQPYVNPLTMLLCA